MTTVTPSSLPLAWISRDAWLIITARSLRSFAQTSVAILLAVYLNLLGFSLLQTGIFISLGLAGSTFFSFLVVLFGEVIGRRVLMVGFTVLSGVTGVALALTDQYVLLAFTSFVGAFNVIGGGPTGPVQPLERASLAQSVDPSKRTDLFAIFQIAAMVSRALGVLAVSLPLLYQSLFDMSEVDSMKVMFAIYAAASMIAGGIYALLSPSSEAPVRTRGWTNPFTLPSRRLIFSMSALFSLDSFGTRFVIQSFVAFWFVEEFGVDLKGLTGIFFISTMLSATSAWIAAKLANRFGLVNVIVFTHVPAVLAVTAIPFMPNAALAIAVWFVRAFFSQMDGPTKQSYTMAVVGSEERVALAGVSQLGQSGLGAAAPPAAGILWESLWVGAPFVASGVFKTLYLIGFYFMFRNVRPPEEEKARVRDHTAR